MNARAQIDTGICGFPATASISTEDQRYVQIDIDCECKSVRALDALWKKVSPIDAIAELGPDESVIMKTARGFLQSKGCCEACVVPVAVSKAVQVATGLALPKDVSIKLEAHT